LGTYEETTESVAQSSKTDVLARNQDAAQLECSQ